MPRFKQDELGRILSHEPTDDQRKEVIELIADGLTHELTALKIGIDGKTLRKHYRAELDQGKAILHGAMVKTLAQQALGGNTKALTFYLERQVEGYARKDQVNHTGGQTVRIVIGGQPLPQFATAKVLPGDYIEGELVEDDEEEIDS